MNIQPRREIHPDAYLLEPREVFDKALLGAVSFPEDHWRRVEPMNVAVYDSDICIEVIQEWLECNYEDALDYYCYNAEGAWVGEGTPTFTRKRGY